MMIAVMMMMMMMMMMMIMMNVLTDIVHPGETDPYPLIRISKTNLHQARTLFIDVD